MTMLMRFDPLREFDRVFDQAWSQARQASIPMDAYRRGDSFVINLDLPGVDPSSVDLTVEPLNETRSRLTISVDFDGHGIGKVLIPLLVRRQAQREMPSNLAMLKQRLEAPVLRQHRTEVEQQSRSPQP